MTIAATITAKQYTSNGVTTQYAFPNKIFSASDLVVTLIDLVGNQYPFTNFANATAGLSYTVQGVDVDTGCTVVFSGAQTFGWTVDIRSLIPDTQSTSIKNQGSFFPELHEEAFDRATRMIQDLLRLTYFYGIHGPDIETVPWPALPGVTARKGMALMFDALTGLPTLGVPNTQTITTGLLAPFLNLQQSPAEIAAGVTPANLGYALNDVRRHGVVGNGIADDTAGWTKVVLVMAQGQAFDGQNGAVYVLSANVTMGSKFLFDGHGATFKPASNLGRFVSQFTTLAPNATATTTVSSGATRGARTCVVASATGLVVGQWVEIYDTAQLYPAYWGKITSIAGTTIGLDRVFPCTYAGALNFYAFNSLASNMEVSNVYFDGTNIAASPGNDGFTMRVVGYEYVRVTKVGMLNFAPSTGANVWHGEDNISVLIDACTSKTVSCPNSVDTFYSARARKLVVTRMHLENDTFGFGGYWCETFTATSNIIQGQLKYEVDNAISPLRSVRGIKALGCYLAIIQANSCTDYTTAIRVEKGHRYIINGNAAINCALSPYLGDQVIAAANSVFVEEVYGVISNNFIENCGGTAISVDDGNAGATDGNVIVISNNINGCERYAIYAPSSNVLVAENRIRNWNNSGVGVGDGSAAIYNGAGLIAVNNEFKNTNRATDVIFRTFFQSGSWYYYSGNVSLSGNPNFGAGLDVNTRGTANITAAATTVTFNHNCVHTPTAQDVTLQIGNIPTNDIGEWALTAITATQLTVVCRNAPGASTVNIPWAVTPRGPWQAP